MGRPRLRRLLERRVLNVLSTREPPDALKRSGNARRLSLTLKLQPQLQGHGVQAWSKKRRQKKRLKERQRKRYLGKQRKRRKQDSLRKNELLRKPSKHDSLRRPEL